MNADIPTKKPTKTRRRVKKSGKTRKVKEIENEPELPMKGSYITRRDARMNYAELKKQTDGSLYTREHMILHSIHKYYSEPGRLDRILPYIDDKEEALSLRDFESFNVHVAPIINAHFFRDVIIPGKNGEKRKELFVIYPKYKATLKNYNKGTFDPFRRGNVLEFFYTKYNPDTEEHEQYSINTAICQLNYFYWIQMKGILDYILEHISLISRVTTDLEMIKKTNGKEEYRGIIESYQRNIQVYNRQDLTLDIPHTSAELRGS